MKRIKQQVLIEGKLCLFKVCEAAGHTCVHWRRGLGSSCRRQVGVVGSADAAAAARVVESRRG